MRNVPGGVFRPGPDRISGTITAPAAMPVMRARRFSSGVSRVCFAGDGRVDQAKLMPPVGQSLRQFRHRWHSALRHVAPGIGSSPPWQWSRQRRHSSHFSSCLRIWRSDQREQTPSIAPRGQMARHQKRVTRVLRTRTKTNRVPMSSAPLKCGCLKLRMVALRIALETLTAACSGRELPAVRRVEARADGQVDRRHDRHRHRPHHERDRVEQQAGHRPEQRHHQHRGEQVVLRRLPLLVAVRLDELRAALGVRLQAADEVVQRAQRADPAAERPADEDGEEQEGDRPQEVAVERAGGERRGEGDERIGLEEPADRPRDAHVERRRPDRARELGANQQEQEQGEKEDLRRQAEAAQRSVPHVGAHDTAGWSAARERWQKLPASTRPGYAESATRCRHGAQSGGNSRHPECPTRRSACRARGGQTTRPAARSRRPASRGLPASCGLVYTSVCWSCDSSGTRRRATRICGGGGLTSSSRRGCSNGPVDRCRGSPAGLRGAPVHRDRRDRRRALHGRVH